MWSQEVGYAKRWKVEGVFSAMKRIFGEGSTSDLPEGDVSRDTDESERSTTE